MSETVVTTQFPSGLAGSLRLLGSACCVLAGTMTATAIAQETDDLLRYSLQVTIDEPAREQLKAADADLAGGDRASAAARWRAVLDAPTSAGLIPSDEVFRAPRSFVTTLLKSQSSDVLEEYLRLSDPPAKAAFDRALAANDLAALWEVARRYPMTPAARQALEEIAARCFDSAEFGSCAAACRMRVFQELNPSTLARGTPQVLSWWVISQHRGGDPAAASQILAQFAADLPRDWLDRIQRELQLSPPGADPDAAVAESSLDEAADVRDVLPSGETLWTVPFPLADESWRQAGGVIRDFEPIAHPLLALKQPLSQRDLFLTSGAGDSVAVNQSGMVGWTFHSEGLLDRAQPADVARRLLGESVLQLPSVQGDRVYWVAESWIRPPGPTGLPLLPEAREAADGVQAPPPPFNLNGPRPLRTRHIVAVSLASGEAVWRSEPLWTDADGSHLPIVVLGPPVEHRGTLFWIEQVGDVVQLVAGDRDDGRRLWSVPLGQSGLPLEFDPRRLWMKSIVRINGDRALCAPGNGAVACVDLLTRSVQWVHRLPRQDWRNAGPPMASVPPMAPRMRLWAGWQEPVLERVGSVLLWTSPESDALTALDPGTGRLVWSRRRGEGLVVQPIADRILLLESRSVSLLNSADGAVLWTSDVPPLAGRGFVARGWIVLPLRSGGTIALRARDGLRQRAAGWNAEIAGDSSADPATSLRTLTWTPNGILIQDLFGVRLEKVAAAIAGTTPQTLATGADLTSSLAALRAARESSDGDDRAGRTLELARLLEVALEAADGSQRGSLASELRALADGEADPSLRIRRLTRSLQATRSVEGAVALLAGIGETGIDDAWAEPNGLPRRRVRADAFALATLIDVPAEPPFAQSLKPEAISAIETQLQTWNDQGRPELGRQLLLRLSETEWGAGRWLESLKESSSKFLEWSQEERLGTLLALARLQAPGSPLKASATAIARSLTPTADSEPGKWPTIDPRVSPRKWTSTIEFRPGWREIAGPTSLARMNVEPQIQGRRVQFSGQGEDRPWSLFKFPDRDSASKLPSRSLQGSQDLQRSWLVGPLAIIQMGTRLYGIQPLGDDGRRQARLVWPANDQSVDAWGQASTMNVNFLPRLADVAPGPHVAELDEFGRPLAQVGPVRAAYLGVREFNRLVIYDTATGRRRWDRDGLTPKAEVFGDDEACVIWTPDTGAVEVLRPLDGGLIRRETIAPGGRDIIAIRGRMVILREDAQEKGTQLSAIDFATGRPVWTQQIGATAAGFVAGDLAGVVEPGQVRLFNATTGELRATATCETPEGLDHAAAIVDEHALVVLGSGPPTVNQTRLPLVGTGGPRRPWANGFLHGFDPETLNLRWTLPIDESVFPLDQPVDVPIFVINDALPPADEIESPLGNDRLRIFDKRTGKLLYEGFREELGRAQYVVERNEAAKWIDVRASKAIVRLRYGVDPSEAEEK